MRAMREGSETCQGNHSGTKAFPVVGEPIPKRGATS